MVGEIDKRVLTRPKNQAINFKRLTHSLKQHVGWISLVLLFSC